jgi:hypothetical protein
MDTEVTREVLAEFSAEICRHFDVTVESLRSEIRLLTEGVAKSLRTDLASLHRRIERLEAAP